MSRRLEHDDQESETGDSRPRGILRVPEVIIACASKPNGGSLAALSKELKLPKTSLHRLLRTLEHGGYLSHQAGHYVPGPASFHMAHLIGQLQPPTNFQAVARPSIERLAKETNESVMLGILSEDQNEILFVDAIDSTEPLRYTLPIGGRRALFCGASGKVALAFLSPEFQADYLARTEFFQITPSTVRKEEMPALLTQINGTGVVYDRNGNFEGASAIASPIFNNHGAVFGAVSLAGPTERTDAHLKRFQALCRDTGERISRALGYMGKYPPSS